MFIGQQLLELCSVTVTSMKCFEIFEILFLLSSTICAYLVNEMQISAHISLTESMSLHALNPVIESEY